MNNAIFSLDVDMVALSFVMKTNSQPPGSRNRGQGSLAQLDQVNRGAACKQCGPQVASDDPISRSNFAPTG
jgi:hypothetical protein